LAAAVSETGGLGLITAGTYKDAAALKAEIAVARQLTQKPFGVNITLGTRRPMDEFFAACVEEGIKIIITSGRNPEKFVPMLKDNGIIFVHVVTAVRHGLKAQGLGADAVVMVGCEAGGHPGMDDVSLTSLIPKAVDTLKIPVIAAGSITDGRGLASALCLGAQGVQMGTRFLVTKESPAHENVKSAIIQANENDTIMIERSFRNARRVLKTPLSQWVLAKETEGASFEELKEAIGGEAYIQVMAQGLLDKGVLTMGQGSGNIHDIPTVQEVIDRIVSQANAVLAANNCL